MARYLIEATSEADSNRLSNLLKHTLHSADVYVSTFGKIFEAELTPSEVVQVSSVAMLYADMQLSPFIGDDFVDDDLANIHKTVTDVLNHISAPAAWAYDGDTGDGVTLVNIDSGIDTTMGAFPLYKRGSGLSLSFSDGPWNDTKGHGTMTAGVAAAIAVVSRFNGVAPSANVFPCRTNFTVNDVFKLLDMLRRKILNNEIEQPVVINCSLGWESSTPPNFSFSHPLVALVKDLTDREVVVVCAAGNNHDSGKCASCKPSADTPNTIWGINSLDEVICVGAVDHNDENIKGSHSKSSRGPGQFSREHPKPDCVAPCYGTVLWGNTYLWLPWWGTSGAAPLVAGLACLILGRAKKLGQPVDIKEVILKNCRNVGQAPTRLGAGVIDCFAAIKSL